MQPWEPAYLGWYVSATVTLMKVILLHLLDTSYVEKLWLRVCSLGSLSSFQRWSQRTILREVSEVCLWVVIWGSLCRKGLCFHGSSSKAPFFRLRWELLNGLCPWYFFKGLSLAKCNKTTYLQGLLRFDFAQHIWEGLRSVDSNRTSWAWKLEHVTQQVASTWK